MRQWRQLAPGATTAEVNAAFERTMLELGGTSNFYGYYDSPGNRMHPPSTMRSFTASPATTCSRTATSFLSTVAHTLSTPQPTASGTATSARTVLVGDNVSEARAELRRHSRGNVARHRRSGNRKEGRRNRPSAIEASLGVTGRITAISTALLKTTGHGIGS